MLHTQHPAVHRVLCAVVRFDELVSAGYSLSLTAGSAEARGPPSTPAHLRFRICTYWSMLTSDVDAFVERMICIGQTLAT